MLWGLRKIGGGGVKWPKKKEGRKEMRIKIWLTGGEKKFSEN